jgi:triple functional domain protein
MGELKRFSSENWEGNENSILPRSYIAEIRNANSDIPMPDDLKGGKERMVFGNVEAIYEWHRE